jgi:hypothetical protein
MMRKTITGRSTEWTQILSLVLVLSASCAPGEKATSTQAANLPESFEGDFIIRLVSVQPELETQFIDYVRECCVPLWNELRSEDLVSSVGVFELGPMESTVPEARPWSFLLIAKSGSQNLPDEFFSAKSNSICRQQSDESLFTVLREERMSCTPNSCYAMPEPTYVDAELGIDFLIEFIGVEDTPTSLKKYRDLMADYFGPANGLLVEREMLHCFVGLETTATLSEIPGVPAWNQIHFSDHWEVGGEVDWDTVYADLFRSEFSRELDDVWSELPPFPGPRNDFRGRLVPDLCVR